MQGGNDPCGAWARMMVGTDNTLAACLAVKAVPAVVCLQQKSSTIVRSAVELAPDNDAPLLLQAFQQCPHAG